LCCGSCAASAGELLLEIYSTFQTPHIAASISPQTYHPIIIC
jgi:hypothetical protein